MVDKKLISISKIVLNEFNAPVCKVVNKVYRRGPSKRKQPLDSNKGDRVPNTIGEEPEILENTVIRENQGMGRLSLWKLHKWIESHFISLLANQYDWLALWRVLYDHNLIAQGEHQSSKFEKQMNDWFPDAKMACSAKEMNRFRKGYLGDTPYTEWEKAEFFRKRDTDKQSTDGFERLKELCDRLGPELKAVLDNKELRQD